MEAGPCASVQGALGSDVAEYTYDALGRRVENIDYTGEGAVTTRWYLAGWCAVEERDGDDALQATFINGARLDEYILMNRNSTNYLYMESAIIGNVAALVNSSGSIQEGYTYRGYGQATVHTGAGNDSTWFTSDDPTATSSALGNPYLFTGRDWDSTISLQYSRARWYTPIPGRWLSRDLAGYADAMTLYEYVGSRPAHNNDPFGNLIYEEAPYDRIRGYPAGFHMRAGLFGRGAEVRHTVISEGEFGQTGADFSPVLTPVNGWVTLPLGAWGRSHFRTLVLPLDQSRKLPPEWYRENLFYRPEGDLYWPKENGRTIPCACATIDMVDDCIKKKSQEWDNMWWRLLGSAPPFDFMAGVNCKDFAEAVVKDCCFKPEHAEGTPYIPW